MKLRWHTLALEYLYEQTPSRPTRHPSPCCSLHRHTSARMLNSPLPSPHRGECLFLWFTIDAQKEEHTERKRGKHWEMLTAPDSRIKPSLKPVIQSGLSNCGSINPPLTLASLHILPLEAQCPNTCMKKEMRERGKMIRKKKEAGEGKWEICPRW